MEKQADLYFTSDLHGYMYPTDYRGAGERDIGLFKCANRFQKGGNTLVIDGGDVLQGSAFAAFCHESLGSAAPIAQIMNECGYDYVTLGNHDFNFGSDYLLRYLDALTGRCVCENFLTQDGAVPFPHCVRTLANGLRVGLVGIVTDHVNIWEKAEHLAGYQITDPFAAARQALEDLRGRADVTVGIYHGGFERDLTTGRVLSHSTENIAYRICQELTFDILLTGHQHMTVPGRWLFGTYVVQPADNGREFHHLRLCASEGKLAVTDELIPAGGTCDGQLLQRFSAVEQGAQEWMDQVVGHLAHPLRPDAPLAMAAGGSEIAELFNRVQLHYSGAQLSAVSLANEIAGFPQTVRRRDVLTTYPYTNTLVVVEVTGAVLRRAMERSAEYFTLDTSGELAVSDRFLKPKVEHYNYDYFAGVTYTVDVTRPEGRRVTSLCHEGRPVADNDTFTLCMNNYRFSGAGGYPDYQSCPVVKEVNTEMWELIMDYLEKQGGQLSLPERNYRVVWKK